MDPTRSSSSLHAAGPDVRMTGHAEPPSSSSVPPSVDGESQPGPSVIRGDASIHQRGPASQPVSGPFPGHASRALDSTSIRQGPSLHNSRKRKTPPDSSEPGPGAASKGAESRDDLSPPGSMIDGRPVRKPTRAKPKSRGGGTLSVAAGGPRSSTAKRATQLLDDRAPSPNPHSSNIPPPHPHRGSSTLPRSGKEDTPDGGGEGGREREAELDSNGEEETEERKEAKRRNRVHFSCVECHRRKQKCDRLQPCTPCQIRKVPHMCRPFINGFEDPGVYEGDLKARLGRIEGLLERLLPIVGPILEGAVDLGTTAGGVEPGVRTRRDRRGGDNNGEARESEPVEVEEKPVEGLSIARRHSRGRNLDTHPTITTTTSTITLSTEPVVDGINRGSAATTFGSGIQGHAGQARAPGINGSDRVVSGSAAGVGVGSEDVSGGARTGRDGQDTTILDQPVESEDYTMRLVLPSQASPPETASSPSLSSLLNARQSPFASSSSQVELQPSQSQHSQSRQPVPRQQWTGQGAPVAKGFLTTSGRPPIILNEPSQELRGILETLAESGITRKMLVGLLESVPEKGMSDSLVELYFREIDWTRYKLHRPAFSHQYIQFFNILAEDPQNPALDKGLIKWLPLYFAVLAIATLSATADMVGGETGQKAWSRRFHGSSRIALSSAKALQRDNLDVIYAGLLTARYMLLVRRAAEGSTPLTSAYQLGLYRDGSVLNLNDKKEIELRRRAWAMVYHLDRTTALLVGRPTSISDAHSDTREPANLDDLELETDFDPRGHSLMKPTEWTQLILRHRLAQIIGRISDHTFAIKPPDYSAVLKLDRELLAWQSNLPSFFAIHHANTSLDPQFHFIFVQRHLLACEFLFARITLHRPYLLRKRDQADQYAYSREAAIESAKADLIGRRLFLFEKPVDLKVNSGGYRVLNSYIVLGVAIKLDPTSPRAEELRQLLDVVAGTAPDELGRYSEPMVKDEMAIVDFLTQRARTAGDGGNAIRSSAPIPPYSHILPSHRNAPSMLTRTTESNIRGTQDDMYRPTVSDASRQAEDPAWSFVAPQLASLDVHQPFGQGATGQKRGSSSANTVRFPPPLAAPRPRQRNPHNIPPWEQAGWENPYATPVTEPIKLGPSPQTVNGDLPSGSYGGSQPVAQPQNGLRLDLNRMTYQLDATGYQPAATNGPANVTSNNNVGNNTAMTPSDWADWDTWWNSNQATLGTASMVAPANSGTTGQMGFNPFALSQFGLAEEEEVVEESSETAFLNLLLSTIANTSAPN